MLIILPPSETKAHGGTQDPLNWDKLSFPRLNPARQRIAQALSTMGIDEAMQALKLSEKLRPEAESNQRLFSSPTMPAIERYTGVLYDALEVEALTPASRKRLAVGDALFGLLRANDPIPHYRLSGSSKLEGKTMKSLWSDLISTELDGVDGLVVDLRSGVYQQLGKCKDAVTVRVESLKPDGTRTVVSHFNKHYKGQLARLLALSHQEPTTAQDVAEVATAAGMTAHVTGKQVTLTV